MIYDLSDPYQQDEFRRRILEYMNDGAIVELARRRLQRSLRQNAYMHVLIAYFASQYGCGADEAKVDFFKRAANRDLFEREAFTKGGRRATVLRSTSDLSKDEAGLAIDRFKNWSASVAGIYLPEADDEKFLAHAMREIKKNEEFVNLEIPKHENINE